MVHVENRGLRTLRLTHGVTLPPGVTPVDPEAWHLCCQNHYTRHFLTHQTIGVVSGPVATDQPTGKFSPTAGSDAYPIDRMGAKEAIAWIRKCTDHDSLVDLQEDGAETRSTVLQALASRLDDLEGEGD